MNVSTAVALVAAAAGLRMAKHGNRSFSSLCGSADVLEALGAKLDVTPARSRHLLDAIGFCFLFAPNYHPGLKHAGPVRRRLRVRTIMNLLGPRLNPSEPPIQLLGVADPLRLQGVSSTLIELGVERALVVHGSGLDEVALHGVTDAIRITNGFAESIRITPADAGLEKVTLDELRGGRSVKEKAEQLKAVLGGYAPSSLSNLVAINTGALLWTAGVCDTLKEASALAAETIAAGKAGRLLKEYVELSRFE